MKVILTAFNGKLKSEVMDWPESVGPRARLALEKPLSPTPGAPGGEVPELKPGFWIGVFELEKEAYVAGIGRVLFYRLVGVEG